MACDQVPSTTHIVPISVLICALDFLFSGLSACQGGEGSSPEATPSELPTKTGPRSSRIPFAGSPLAPDVACVIVRDLKGYFDDCGCGGPLRGGVARMPAAAAGVGDVRFVFIGNTVIPDKRNLKGAAGEADQLQRRVAFAVQVLPALPRAELIAGAEEWHVLEATLGPEALQPLRRFRRDRFDLSGQSVRITQDDLDLGGGG